MKNLESMASDEDEYIYSNEEQKEVTRFWKTVSYDTNSMQIHIMTQV